MCGLQTNALAIGANSYIPIFAYDQTNQKLYFFDSANNAVLLCFDTGGAGVCAPPAGATGTFTITGTPPCVAFVDGGGTGSVCIDASGNITVLGSAGATVTATGANNAVLKSLGTGFAQLSSNGITGVSLDQYGHLSMGGGSPGVISCGSGAAITGNDIMGRVAPGSGSPTSCQINFGHAYGSQPFCTVSPNATVGFNMSQVSTTGNVIVYSNGTVLPNFNYFCAGQ